MTTLRIATANLNGVRAAVRRGFGSWLQQRAPDIVAVQEVRCPEAQLPHRAWPAHRLSYHPGLLAGRNGVGVLTRWPPSAVRSGFGSRAFDTEGRYLEIDLEPPDAPPLTIGSLYLPKGGNADDGPAYAAKQKRKLRFMASFGNYLTGARRHAHRALTETWAVPLPLHALTRTILETHLPCHAPETRVGYGRAIVPPRKPR